MVTSKCKKCGKETTVGGSKPRIFCSRVCSWDWKKNNKCVSKDWLHQKYVVEGLDCTQISLIVNRNSKRVWEWLRDFGIQTRARGYASPCKFKKGQESFFKGKKHTEESKNIFRKLRLKDGRVPYLKNGIHHLKGKRGSETPNWKGGCTPDRAKVYDSKEWKKAVKIIWKRDNATCKKCGLHKNTPQGRKIDFDIHHIESFSVEKLRCFPDNLVLLCEPCHYWVHSKKNKNKEFIK